ncbi:MAG: S1 RNA-binding domain-containing protein [Phycisphaerae bacterium]|nr:S1 RNA-binding domain-containing protein [Phycisphaerae bacterium]
MNDSFSTGQPGDSAPDPTRRDPESQDHTFPPAGMGDDHHSLAEIDQELLDAMNAASEPATRSGSAGSGGAESLERGTELVGTIAAVNDDDIFLDFGPKSQGLLPRNQFGKKEPLPVGRKVDVVVDHLDPETGLVIVNRKGAVQRATWTNLEKGMMVEGRVTGLVKGGLEVSVQGIRTFMPASQVELTPLKDISVLLNQNVRCEVLEVDRRSKNVLVSRRKVLEKEVKEKRQHLKEELETGQTRKGTVRSITDFGAFVDLGGLDGLVHVSDMSWGNVGKVEDVLSVGQEVEVKVLKIDRERDRISLGMKQLQPDPWAHVEERFPEGSKVKARVTRLANFGAFAELESGIEGLIPLSEMGWNRVGRSSDAVREGELVDAVILRVEPKKRRLALSMKNAQADPWAGVMESFPANSLVKGRVTRLADFGAFVEIVPGVEGLIHISEMSTQRVRSAGDVVKVGEEVEVRVLGVDLDNRRMSLSIKAVAAPMEETQEAHVPAEPEKPKKRKKPLRGGLSSHFDW